MLKIQDIQEVISAEFALVAEDMELTLHHVMDQGKKLPPLAPEDQQPQYLVKGCQSKVWLISSVQHSQMHYRAQSDTAITRGLVSLLLRIFSGQCAADIVRAELFFPARIGMSRFIGTQRSGGLGRMFSTIQQHALQSIISTKK